MKKALIVWGGWEGHEPDLVSDIFAGILRGEGFEVEVQDTLDAVLDITEKGLDLFIPIWTSGNITSEQSRAVRTAVESGVGIAGCHGGMCDSFRNDVDWQFMTGGQWVAHPGNDGTPYRVNIRHNASSPIVYGLSDFDVCSEQYYCHVDPVINVLATTRFPVSGGPHVTNGFTDNPVVWTKLWGKGRVFYNALGHHADVFNIPQAKELMRRGFLWASCCEQALYK